MNGLAIAGLGFMAASGVMEFLDKEKTKKDLRDDIMKDWQETKENILNEANGMTNE